MSFRAITHTMALAFIGLALVSCSSPEEKEANYLKRGNKLLEEGQYEKARIEYRNAGRIKPTDPEIAYRLGLVDEAEGNIHGAFVEFEHAEQQNANYAPALLKLGAYYIAAEQYDQAQKRIDVVMGEAPNDAEAHALHAAIMLREKNYDETEKESRFALTQDISNVTAYSVLAGLYSTQGDAAKAEAMVEDGIAHNPTSLSLLLLKARLNEATNNLPDILAAYEAIFKLKPTEEHFHYELAGIELRMGKIDEAEAALREGIAAMPNSWDMKHQLVLFLDKEHGVDAAEKEILGYMKSNPEKDDLYTWLVDLYTEHKDMDRATALLNKVIAEHPSDKQALVASTALARIDYFKGDKAASAKLVADVLAKDQNNTDALFLRARIALDNGFYRDAVGDLRNIIRDRPKAKQALQLLSEALLLQGHLDLAIDTMNQFLELDPNNTAARVRLAQLYSMNSDSKHAMDMLFLITKATPDYPVAWEATARIAIETKDWTTADMAIDKLDHIEGQHILAAFLHGQVLMNNNKPDEAIAQFKQVIEAGANSSLAEHAIADLVSSYRSLHREEDAAHYIESLKSSSPFVDTALGEVYLDLGKTDMAAAALNRAIDNHSTRPETYLDRATLLVRDHKVDPAIDTLKKATIAAPSDIRALVMEAEILGSLGRYQEAIAIYDDLLARNPELNVVANNMAELIADYEYTDAAALDKARQVAERFIAMPNPLLLDTLAWVYYRQGNIQQAQTIMERAVAQGDKLPPQIHYHYGAILIKAGDTQKAKAELQQAVGNGVNYPGLADAQKMLGGL